MFTKNESKLGLVALTVELDILLQALRRHSIPECAHFGVDGAVVYIYIYIYKHIYIYI